MARRSAQPSTLSLSLSPSFALSLVYTNTGKHARRHTHTHTHHPFTQPIFLPHSPSSLSLPVSLILSADTPALFPYSPNHFYK